MEDEKKCIVYLSTYPPRKCGIATFTQDLSTAVEKVSSSLTSKIAALNNGNTHTYNDDVLYELHDKDEGEYEETAQKINENPYVDAVSIQHEFKIFGSDHGENVLAFLRVIEKPVITTFHTVLPAPSEKRKEIVQAIAQYSEYVIVMTQSAVDILTQDYGIEPSKLVIIPHGIHDLPYEKNTGVKKKLRYQDRQLLTSFGFLRPGRARNSSGKGHEYVLDALPVIVKRFPNVLYLIIGVTHPKYLKLEGERYREFLQDKVRALGLEHNVKFINEFLSLDTLFQYLKASDVYVCSPLNENQVTSGTLVYAMGCGRAVVSTPFLHAKDMVSRERGILTEFKHAQSFADAILEILSNPALKQSMEQNAYAYTRRMTWTNVALAYHALFHKVIRAEGEMLPLLTVQHGKRSETAAR
jgi:polysaccharide biosynthesis protein PslF